MSREDVLAVIKKYILESLEDLDVSEIDPDRSMKDYGANSLDIIEIVACAMRELRIKIPRSELADLTNIAQLADKFHEKLQASQAV